MKAIDIARRQGAKSLELRATMSLARLLRRQGKNEEAHQMLAQTYGRFTEGFDTADLREARALLEEMRAAIKTRTEARQRAAPRPRRSCGVGDRPREEQ